MNRLLGPLVAALVVACASASAQTAVPAPPAAQPAAPAGPARFEPEILKFEEADRVAPPPDGGVVFTGSSSIRLWPNLAADFPGIHTINRGFGGSEIPDAIHYLDRLVIKYKPAQVVLYSGDNDLNGGKSPEAVAAEFKRFVDAVHQALPKTRIVIIGIKPSLARWALVEQARDTNRRVQALVAADPARLAYVDVFAPMLGADGKPRPELYVADGLHMTAAGYEIWKRALTPALR